MSFKIDNKKKYSTMKSIRFPQDLSNKITKISNKNNITFSKFIVEACIYALDNLEEDNTNSIKKVKKV